MAKKNRKKQAQDEPRELTRKQQHINARDRARNRKVVLAVSITLGLVAAVLLIGILSEFVFKPNSSIATVGGEKISTRAFQERVKYEQSQLENQYVQLNQLEQQFGGQGFFTSQISQIEATLSSPFSLGMQTLDRMINETVIRQQAAEQGISVSAEEIDAALREEVAAADGAVTEPQATSTAEAAVAATTTAEAWTPTPTATIDASGAITATATPMPTPEPAPTRPLLTEEQFQDGLKRLADNLSTYGLKLDDYRKIVETRLLSDKLAEIVADERVSTTEEQVHARHILLREITPTPEPTAVPEGQPTPEPTATATPLPEGFPTPAPTPAPRSLDEALALAQELRQRIIDGEDFAALAAEYSDDLSNAQNGGDLGWFGRGMMVPEFEEAAFNLPIGEVSEPVETQFGVHLLEVLERDDARPKDQATIDQERSQAYADWLQEQTTATDITRNDLESRLPRDLTVSPVLLGGLPSGSTPADAPPVQQ